MEASYTWQQFELSKLFETLQGRLEWTDEETDANAFITNLLGSVFLTGIL